MPGSSSIQCDQKPYIGREGFNPGAKALVALQHAGFRQLPAKSSAGPIKGFIGLICRARVVERSWATVAHGEGGLGFALAAGFPNAAASRSQASGSTARSHSQGFQGLRFR